jgi:regulator of sigma E protease
MLAILAPIFVFGLVIFVHELGHFLAAKSFGVYTLAMLPLGGYVRMASRHDEASAFLEGGSEEGTARPEDDPNFDPNAMIPFGPKPVPEHRWFESKALWKRMVILLAGVFMNFTLGLVVAIGLTYQLGTAVVNTRVIGGVRPVNGRPMLAALQPGDTIRSVNGQPVATWNQVIDRILDSRDAVSIETNRTTVAMRLDSAGAPTADAVAAAIDFLLPPVIGDTVPGEQAAKAGLGAGDSVIAINGQPLHSWNEMVAIVANSANTPLTLTVVRAGQTRSVTLTPRPMDAIHPATGQRAAVGKIGAYSKDIATRAPVSFPRAIRDGSVVAWRMSTAIVGAVRDMATRRRSVKELGGVIEITRASVQAARAGLESLFYLIALLSINLAVLNLLPIPILDGGQIVLNVIESAKGSPLSDRTREYVLRFGLAVILLLVVFGLVNDILRPFR